MLYSLLIAVFILAVSIPPLCLLSFRWGFRYGRDGEKAVEEKVVPQLPRAPHKESEEMKRQRKILQNMENYSGDGSNQVDI